MARSVYIQDLTNRAGDFTSDRKASNGHIDWSMTAKFVNAGVTLSLTVQLLGTNDPGDTTGEEILSITGTADGSVTKSATGRAYRYVFWKVSARTNLDLDEVRVWGSGFAGTV